MRKKKAIKMQSGGLLPRPTLPRTTREDVTALFTPENMADALYQIRYGMNAEDKVRFADSGVPLGVSPEEAQASPAEADRAASAFLGTRKWGPTAAFFFNELRNRSGISKLMGETAEQRKALHEAAMQGASRALQTPPIPTRQKGGKVPRIRVPARDLVKRYASGGIVYDPTQDNIKKQQAKQKAQQGQVQQAPAPGAPTGGWTPSQQSRFNLPGGQNPNQPNIPTGANAQNVVGQTLGAIQGIQPDTRAMTGVANQLQGFNPNYQANTQPMMQTAGRLGNFNPIQGQAANTLQNIIATGAPVDTAPITQAAQIRGQQGFQDFMGQANEGFGAMGLGSSSARTAALGREAGRLQQGIAATGMEAEVGAQEAARQRQLQGYNPLLAGSGQQLQGLGMAGGLQGQAAGLGLEGQIASGGHRLGALQGAGALHGQASGLGLQGQIARAGQFNQLSGNLIPPTVGVNQQAPAQPLPGGGQPNTSGYWSGVSGNRSTGGFARGQQGGRITPQGIERYADGGRVDLGDYLGQLTFGQKFTRPDFVPQASMRPTQASPAAPDRERSALTNSLLREQLAQMQRTEPGVKQGPDYGLLSKYLSVAGRGMTPIGMSDPRAMQEWLKWMGPQRTHEGLMQTGRLMGPTARMDPGDERANTAYERQLEMMKTAQGRMHGGKIDGPAVPPDVVPIMAQGGEGVIPIHLMHRLENAKRPKQLASVAREIQTLMGKEPKLNSKDIQRKQRGGKIAKVMHEFKAGSLRSGGPNGPVVKDRKQAIAIALSEAREEGERVAPKKMQTGGPVGYSPSGELIKQLQQYMTPNTWDRIKEMVGGGVDAAKAANMMLAEQAGFGGLTQEEDPSVPAPPQAAPVQRHGFTPSPLMAEEPSSVPQDQQATTSTPQGSLSISVDHLKPGGPSKFGNVREGKGGFSVMGTGPMDPVEKAQMDYDRAQGRSALARTAAFKGGRDVREKMAPIIGKMEAEEAAALQNLQFLQSQQTARFGPQMEVMSRMAQLENEATQSELDRQSQERRTGMTAGATTEAAKIRAQSTGLGGILGGDGAQVSSIDDLYAIPDPQALLSGIQSFDFTGLERNEDNMKKAVLLLQRLAETGAGDVDAEQVANLLAWLSGG